VQENRNHDLSALMVAILWVLASCPLNILHVTIM